MRGDTEGGARPQPPSLHHRGHPHTGTAGPKGSARCHCPCAQLRVPSAPIAARSGLQEVLFLVPRFVRVGRRALLGARRGPAGLAEDVEEDEDEQSDDAVKRDGNDRSGGESRPHRRRPAGRSGAPGSGRGLRPMALAGDGGDSGGAGGGRRDGVTPARPGQRRCGLGGAGASERLLRRRCGDAGSPLPRTWRGERTVTAGTRGRRGARGGLRRLLRTSPAPRGLRGTEAATSRRGARLPIPRPQQVPSRLVPAPHLPAATAAAAPSREPPLGAAFVPRGPGAEWLRVPLLGAGPPPAPSAPRAAAASRRSGKGGGAGPADAPPTTPGGGPAPPRRAAIGRALCPGPAPRRAVPEPRCCCARCGAVRCGRRVVRALPGLLCAHVCAWAHAHPGPLSAL